MSDFRSVTVSSEDTAKPEEAAKPEGEKPTEKQQEIPAGEQKKPEGEKPAGEAKPEGEKPAGEAAKPEGEQPAGEAAQADLDQAATEILTGGKLADATLAALQAKGLTEAQAKVYAAGIKAQAEAAQAKLAERVGGKQQLDSMLAWAKQGGLSETERAAYDGLMTSGNEAQMALALDGLKARHEAALGSPHARVNGASTATDTSPKPFSSNAEIVKAMQDKRYKTDSAYRDAVAKRLAVSNAIRI